MNKTQVMLTYEVFFSMCKTGKQLVKLQIRELDYLRQ